MFGKKKSDLPTNALELSMGTKLAMSVITRSIAKLKTAGYKVAFTIGGKELDVTGDVRLLATQVVVTTIDTDLGTVDSVTSNSDEVSSED